MDAISRKDRGGPSGPTISVVVPAYNEELHIAETLDSVLAQTSPPHEIIVVDDGSTDGTLAALEPYMDRIELIRQQNSGCPAAFNRGFSNAVGEYVALCPADDIWAPQKLEWQAAAIERHPEADIFFGAARNFGLWDEERPLPRGEGILDTEAFAAEMYRENLIPDPTAVIRREKYFELGGYEPLVGEDYEFWMRALAAGAIFHFDRRELAALRMHGGNLSHRALEIWETNLLIHRRYEQLAASPDAVRSVAARDLLMIGYLRAAAGDGKAARRAFRDSLGQRFTVRSLATSAAMSIPGVAGVASKLSPATRRRGAAAVAS